LGLLTRKEKVIAVRLQTPEKIRDLQRKLYLKAKREPKFRFYLFAGQGVAGRYLEHAYRLVRANGGAPGIDGVSFQSIETGEGEAKFVSKLQQELKRRSTERKLYGGSTFPRPMEERGHWGYPPFETE